MTEIDGKQVVIVTGSHDFHHWPSTENFLERAKKSFERTMKQMVGGPGGTHRNKGPRVGRNEPCPCGSGKKFKRCCHE